MIKRSFKNIILIALISIMAVSFVACDDGPAKTTAPVIEKTQDVKLIKDNDAGTKKYTSTDTFLLTKDPEYLEYSAYEVKALKGAKFEDTKVQAYFDSQKWYNPDESYNDSKLNDIEKYNYFLFYTTAKLKGSNFIEVKSPLIFDLTADGKDETTTFTADKDATSFSITVKGIRYTEAETKNDVIEEVKIENQAVKGKLTGKVYLANLINISTVKTFVFESVDGNTYYNTVVKYWVVPGTEKKPERAKQNILVIGTFIGNVNDNNEVSFNTPQGTKSLDAFYATWESTNFQGFVHKNTKIGYVGSKGELGIARADMYDWNKEVKVLAEINIYKSKIDRTVAAALKPGETWIISQSDDSSWLKLTKKDDPNVTGMLEFNSKLKAITEYKAVTKGNSTTEEKTVGELLSTYLDITLVEQK